MFKTPVEIARSLGERIKLRRLSLGWTQVDSAQRAGISYASWRRLEAAGKASIEDLIKAAIAMRCDRELDQLFPLPAASSMDALLAQQSAISAKAPKQRARAPSRRRSI